MRWFSLKKLIKQNKGQTVVEFALVLPVLIFLLLAIMEGGRIFAAYLEAQMLPGTGLGMLLYTVPKTASGIPG